MQAGNAAGRLVMRTHHRICRYQVSIEIFFKKSVLRKRRYEREK